jgi:hypothetical protein
VLLRLKEKVKVKVKARGKGKVADTIFSNLAARSYA